MIYFPFGRNRVKLNLSSSRFFLFESAMIHFSTSQKEKKEKPELSVLTFLFESHEIFEFLEKANF